MLCCKHNQIIKYLDSLAGSRHVLANHLANVLLVVIVSANPVVETGLEVASNARVSVLENGESSLLRRLFVCLVELGKFLPNFNLKSTYIIIIITV